jgi:helicase required for RNAi-mediated heterochromatin assembly 1
VPDWLEGQRFLNLTSLIPKDIDVATQAAEGVDYYNADVLQGFPKIPCSGMDESQLQACERMITKQVSIVQGPPGTGKTFTSVAALRVLIENLEKDAPPIIIAAQTNHALDQLLNHILHFEPNILRLGGRSDKENTEILQRTLYMLRSTTTGVPNGARGMKTAIVALEHKQKEIQDTVQPLVSCWGILSDDILFQAGIITEEQKDSLYDDVGWATGEDNNESAGGPSRFERCRCFRGTKMNDGLILARAWRG